MKNSPITMSRALRVVLSFIPTVVGCMIGAMEWEQSTGLAGVSPIIGSSVAISALIYTAITAHLIEKDLRINNKKAAIEFITEWQSPAFCVIADKAGTLKEKVIADRNFDISKTLEENKDDIRPALVAVLNFIDKISISVQSDFADETIIRKFFHVIVDSYYHCFRPFILEQRSKHQSDDVWSGVDQLVDRWTRQPEL